MSANKNFNEKFNESMITPDERFDLLSAYIDGEVSGAEEQLVETWLSDDPNFRLVYQQQLKLRQLLIELPAPIPVNSSTRVETDRVVNRVMAEIERRSQRRKWKLAGLGMSVAAIVGVFGSMFTFNSSPQFSPVANSVKPAAVVKEEPVLIAMEEPLVPLPKSMTSK